MFNLIKDRVLIDFYMMTLLTVVKAIVNNRPLTANSDHVDDVEALTPNNFLIEENFATTVILVELVPMIYVVEKRWRQVQFLTEHFERDG